MQIGGGPLGDPEDLAEALRVAATRLGHRPALTVLRSSRRDEQGYASLHRWAAKGAHLLQLEALIEPGDRVAVASPPDWPVLTVCLSAWWVGALIVVGAAADLTIADERADSTGASYALGTSVDGRPSEDGSMEAWTEAVQLFPDAPPASRATRDAPAVEVAGQRWTHAELLSRAGEWGKEGTLGVASASPAELWLPALVRPLLTGRPTVVVDGADRAAISAENIALFAGAS